jgi:hypothetical protein
MPRPPRPGEGGRNVLADDARQAAFDLCAAVRRLDQLTQDPAWKPKLVQDDGPTRADLTDAYQRLHALLHPERENR